MKRRSKAIRTLAAMYDFAPNAPETITAMLKSLYRAITRLNRQNFHRVLAGIERDGRQGKRAWLGE